jgi:hypothetical protein
VVFGKYCPTGGKYNLLNQKLRLRPGHVLALFTDGCAGYELAILEAFGRHYPTSKASIKNLPSRPVLRWPPWLASEQVQKSAKDQSDRIDLKVVRGKARRIAPARYPHMLPGFARETLPFAAILWHL